MIKMQIIRYVHVTESNYMNERKWEIFHKNGLKVKWNYWMKILETHAKIQIWKLCFKLTILVIWVEYLIFLRS